MIAEALHLADEREHVRAQSHGEIAVRIELARLRMLLRLIENGEERVETALVDRDAALIERKRHRLPFPPEFGRASTRRAMDAPKVRRYQLPAWLRLSAEADVFQPEADLDRSTPISAPIRSKWSPWAPQDRDRRASP